MPSSACGQRSLAPLNGYIDIGGYYFRSDVVTGFGGISTGFGVQPLPGVADQHGSQP